jgi:uncharacterized protein YndB with AHSA1/START domain
MDSEPRVAVVRRVMPAPVEVVYGEWLDPEAMSDWMCPRPARCLKVVSQPWVGGKLRIEIEESGVEFFVWGQFKTLDPPRLLRFTWSCSTWDDPDLESMVTVALDPLSGDKTLMTIEHSLLPPELIDEHHLGWGLVAQQLETKLKS